MKPMIRTFSDLPADVQRTAGGKGGTLARLYQAGYPVPDGFVIMPSAFDGDILKPEAWHQVVKYLERFRRVNGKTAFAVRSSALAEDSAFASFAGEYETVLDVHTDGAVRAAIHQVHQSRKAERVKAYSQAKGLDEKQDIAVVVQKLVRADISGILFTADPVTGNRFEMTGNYIYGFGEGLVSGEVEPYTFLMRHPKGKYEGPEDIRRFAKQLYKLASKLEVELGSPQDIEWAIADGKLYLLQSRPITTLLDYDPVTGERNSSFSGDYLWIGSEVMPDVMTPAMMSIFSHFANFNVAGMRGTGNIGGRYYMNFSLTYVLMRAFGQSHDATINLVKLTTGFDLNRVTLPKPQVSRWKIIKSMLPIQREILPMQARLMKRFDEIIAANPTRCQELRQVIKMTEDNASLVELWKVEVFPLFFDLLMIQDKANEGYFFPYRSARKILIKLMGEEEGDALLANLVGGSGQLTSIRPLLGLAKVAHGEMSREEYATLAGHRLHQEDEISIPRPYEDPDWIDKRLAEYEASPIDYDSMLKQKASKFDTVWGEFAEDYPKKAGAVRKKLDNIAAAMEKREVIRSEFTRSLGVVRDWFLQAGELTKLGDDIFFLEDHEVLDVLVGDDGVLEYIPNRRETHKKQLALPRYPLIISGRFDPYAWANDPNRSSEIYDSHAPIPIDEEGDTVKGHPGSTGRVEGVVRIVHHPTEGDQFKTGEILVASSTNVGWTPLFPRAAAVITDVGAPLSHAAIVARELGIPAVVGTSNGTTRLKTGDRVLVDGGQGTVQILGQASS
jgi:pyruvate,water dikinase